VKETKVSHRMVLEEFEVRNGCTLNEFEIKGIKEDIEYHIKVINEGLDEGRDRYFDGFIQSYAKELVGMRTICSHIGISVKTPWIQI
jgi:Holliday junction resolvasome RuvABC ATP-dependent DNA helicase subunit